MASTAETERPRLHASFARGVDFGECLEAQIAAREALIEGQGPPRLFMVEHRPAVTLGRRASSEDVLWSREQLEAAGLSVFETPRGGEATLHAPGQLVAYPVIRVGRQIRAHITTLAEVSIALLAELGIEGARFDMDNPGVWLEADAGGVPQKIASIGLHISRGVSVQGLSLNLDVAPQLFGALVSCGMPQVHMLSARPLATAPWPGFDALVRRWAQLFAEASGYTLAWDDADSAAD